MRKPFPAILILFGLLFVQCEDEKNPFLITQGAIGPLTQTTKMKEIDSIFAQDSIVKLNPIENALGTQGEVEVYSKEGEKLLLLSPENETDPNSTISNVQVLDPRYRTEKGLGLGSTFKEVREHYVVSDVETTINSVVVFLEGSNVFLTIDKKQLPGNPIEIEAAQIPDSATFKYFMIGWDGETANRPAGPKNINVLLIPNAGWWECYTFKIEPITTEMIKILGMILTLLGGLSLIVGVLGAFGSLSLGVAPWALIILGAVFFFAGIGLLKRQKDTDAIESEK